MELLQEIMYNVQVYIYTSEPVTLMVPNETHLVFKPSDIWLWAESGDCSCQSDINKYHTSRVLTGASMMVLALPGCTFLGFLETPRCHSGETMWEKTLSRALSSHFTICFPLHAPHVEVKKPLVSKEGAVIREWPPSAQIAELSGKRKLLWP